MKKSILTLALAALVLTLASCKDEPDFVDVYTPQSGIIAGDVIAESGEYTLTKASNGYAVYKTADKSLIDVYEDYKKLGYIDADGDILYNHVLVNVSDNETLTDKYKFARLSETGELLRGNTTHSLYAFHGDYVMIDGVIYDGNMDEIGILYGEIVSVAPLNEGGTITFAEDDEGVVRSYFYMEKMDSPVYKDYFISIYGAPEDLDFIFRDNNYYFKSGKNYYKFPHSSDALNVISAICDKDGVLRLNHAISDLIKDVGEVTILHSSDGQNMRTLLASPMRVGDKSAYFLGEDAVTYPPEAAYFGEYDRYRSAVNPNAHWLVGASSTFIGFLGTPQVIDNDRTLMHHNGILYKYDGHGGFGKIAEFDKYATLYTGELIAKPAGTEEYVVYGKTGIASKPVKCEKIHDLFTFGAAVSVGNEIRFLDEYGKVLAAVPGYDKDLVLDTEKTGIVDDTEEYNLVFTDPWLRNKEGIPLNFNFYFNIATGEFGLYVGN